MIPFKLERRCSHTGARAGMITTGHGEIPTPIFMPVGTHGTVKTLTPEELTENGARIILGNTYHLYLRPGLEIIQAAGGLHTFTGWKQAILTDSGGYQVFSLAHMSKINGDSVTFRSHIDGSKHELTPMKSIKIQKILGSDIMMSFDECTPYPCDQEYARQALERTIRWEFLSKKAHQEIDALYPHPQFLFGIIQGSVYPELRRESCQRLLEIGFDGYAIGGLAVGEPKEQMFDILEFTTEFLPIESPRYLMGVGKPEDIIRAISLGIDMFDCVIPTRNARNGTVYTYNGRIIMKNSRYKKDFSPIDENCNCYTCQHFSRAYLRHLFMLGEIAGLRLNTIHNIHFFLDLVTRARQAILEDRFDIWKREFFRNYPIEEDHFEENLKRKQERRLKFSHQADSR